MSFFSTLLNGAQSLYGAVTHPETIAVAVGHVLSDIVAGKNVGHAVVSGLNELVPDDLKATVQTVIAMASTTTTPTDRAEHQQTVRNIVSQTKAHYERIDVTNPTPARELMAYLQTSHSELSSDVFKQGLSDFCQRLSAEINDLPKVMDTASRPTNLALCVADRVFTGSDESDADGARDSAVKCAAIFRNAKAGQYLHASFTKPYTGGMYAKSGVTSDGCQFWRLDSAGALLETTGHMDVGIAGFSGVISEAKEEHGTPGAPDLRRSYDYGFSSSVTGVHLVPYAGGVVADIAIETTSYTNCIVSGPTWVTSSYADNRVTFEITTKVAGEANSTRSINAAIVEGVPAAPFIPTNGNSAFYSAPVDHTLPSAIYSSLLTGQGRTSLTIHTNPMAVPGCLGFAYAPPVYAAAGSTIASSARTGIIADIHGQRAYRPSFYEEVPFMLLHGGRWQEAVGTLASHLGRIDFTSDQEMDYALRLAVVLPAILTKFSGVFRGLATKYTTWTETLEDFIIDDGPWPPSHTSSADRIAFCFENPATFWSSAHFQGSTDYENAFLDVMGRVQLLS